VKVLYVVPYDWGGLPHYTAELANAISRHAEVTVLGSKGIKESYFSKDIEIVKIFDKLNFSFNELSRAISPKGLLGLLSFKNIKIIKDIAPDVIHFTTPLFPTLTLSLLYYRLNKKYPILQTKHCIRPITGSTLASYGEVAIDFFESFLGFKRIIVHTQSDKKELTETGRIERDRISVIPHGVYDFFGEYCKCGARIVPNPEEKCVLFFGYIKRYKGLEYLLEALPMAKEEVPGLSAIIAGEGDLSPYTDLMDSCDGIHLEIHNQYLPDEMVPALFQRASVVVLPYTEMSGESGVLNIAYAFGKPVISTDVGGFNEVLIDGVTGYLVPSKDPVALANAITKILNDDGRRKMMETSAKKMCQEYSWDNIAKKHLEVYNEVIEGL
jgi:glycosyltransferase involved in cell wall biosynthesis